MALELFKEMKLECDLPEHQLRKGDVVKLVDSHIAPDDTEGFSIEVFNDVGKTIAVTAVPTRLLKRSAKTKCYAPGR